jgi:polyisoprenoid-binding protein YceI
MSTATTATGTAIEPGNWQIDTVHSHVGFAVKHMVVANFRGSFTDYEGALTVGEDGTPQLRGSVAVDSIAVKDENLAGHLKSPDFFDSAAFPRIDFVSTSVRVDAAGQLEVEGDLTIKGHTQRVKATGAITGPHTDIAGNEKVGAELETVIDRRDYGLDWNAPLPKGGFALENDVTLQVSLELVKAA